MTLYYTILLSLLVFCIGFLVAIFLNLCIYRMPKDEKIFQKNCNCFSCGQPYFLREKHPNMKICHLPSKCDSCGTPMPRRWLFVEILTGLLYTGTFLWFGFTRNPIEAIFTCLFLSGLVIIFFMDLDTMEMSSNVLYALDGIAILHGIYNVATGNGIWWHYLLGGAVMFIPLIALVIATGERALGAGDAWLMLAGGLFLGTGPVVVALFVGLILGSIFGIIKKVRTGDSQFAFGPYLSLGIVAGIFVGKQLAGLYLSICGF